MFEVTCSSGEADLDEIEGTETKVDIREDTKDMPFCDMKPRTLKEVQTAYYVEATAAKKSEKKFFDAATTVLTLMSENYL
ncbi:hypothetical protein MAR_004019 [Mya arenaria]|uniref:Uncharacterized protein n=1 Tax=Mya arenaria TaxID=6604 RepID=A0ABY7EY77_MYAAR|nr:hypothetical protein MAR_004019 [Mya arenaria]